MRSYPAVAKEKCHEYDPRSRPWYKAATSSPKDIIITIDASGSMAGTSLEIAKSAAKVALKTLSLSDFVAVVLLDDNRNRRQLCGAIESAVCESWRQSNSGSTPRINSRSTVMSLPNEAPKRHSEV